MMSPRLFVDGHVHIYAPEQAAEALDAASGNFRAAAGLTEPDAGYGLLLLADPQNAPAFDWLSGLPVAPADRVPEGWSVVARPDDHTLHLTKPNRLPLAVIAGRQIISAENLEVLVFPRTAAGQDGETVQALVASAINADGLAILPWGVGKWLGARGRLIKNVLETNPDHRLATGDNGGRPSFWRNVELLRKASAQGFADIRGSDPLPVDGEIGRIGSFGVSLPAAVDACWDSVRFLNHLCDANLMAYGNPLGFTEFIAKQTALRQRKRT